VRARYYHPGLSRFVSEDPLGLAGGGVNLYVYAGGDPVNHTDPTGLIDPSAVVDIGFILLDLHNLFTGGRKDLGENLAALGLDVLGLLIPIVTGLGAAGRHLDDVDDIGTLGRLGRFCNCFPPGTPILTSEGEKPIEDIQVGDLVYSVDPETGEQSYQPVTGLYQRDGAALITVTTYQGDFQVTGPHPLWVQAKGWTKAQDLTPGDRLLKADGTTVTVTQTGPGPANATIYNLAVNHNHNYYATPQTLLTHNCPVGPRTLDELPRGTRLTTDFDDLADHLRRNHGIDPHTLGERLHETKRRFGLGGADNVVFDMTGNMWDPRTREYLGSLTEGAN
jgi:uncharacterized protein RhaS with RHS repeats